MEYCPASGRRSVPTCPLTYRLYTKAQGDAVLASQAVQDIEHVMYIALYKLDVVLTDTCIDRVFAVVKQFLFANDNPREDWYSRVNKNHINHVDDCADDCGRRAGGALAAA